MSRALAILKRLNPASLLLGPIFQREVLAAGRRRGTYLARFAYAAGLLALVAFAFSGMRQSIGMSSAVSRLQALQQMAPQLALVIVWFQFISLTLAAPILSAGAICDEKRARTLAVLMTTPLTSAQIVLGKLSSRLVHVLILSLIAAPFLLAIRVCGGLDAALVLAAASLTLTTAILGATLGLMFSVGHLRATSAALMGLLTLVLVQAGPSAVEGVIYYSINYRDLGVAPTYQYHEQVLATCAPATLGYLTRATAMGGPWPQLDFTTDWSLLTALSVGAGDAVGGPRTISLGPTWVWCSIYNLLAAGAATLWTIRALRKQMIREASGAPSASARRLRRAARRAAARAARASASAKGARPDAPPRIEPGEASNDGYPLSLAIGAGLPGSLGDVSSAVMEPSSGDHDELVRERARLREVSDSPVLWRELRQSSFGSRRSAIIVAAATLVGMVLLYANASMSDEGLHATIAVLGALVAMIQPVFLTTGGVAGEREARTWEVLLTTPLSGRAVVLGKYLGALRGQWFLLAVALGHLVVAAGLGWVSWWLALHAAMIYAGPALLLTATGQLFSLMFRKAVTAAIANLGVALLLWMASWVVLALAGWFMDWSDERWYDRASNAIYAMNPVAMVVTTAQEGMNLQGRSATYELAGFAQARLNRDEFTLVVLAVLCGYAALGAAALGVAIRAFRRLSGRSS
ncbi:MAG: ABC transporter permease [Phycisphaerales bacterium]